jgi:hypothetical protein
MALTLDQRAGLTDEDRDAANPRSPTFRADRLRRRRPGCRHPSFDADVTAAPTHDGRMLPAGFP